MNRKRAASMILLGLLAPGTAQAAELSASNLTLDPAATGNVIVSGDINGEATLGVTILVQITPRPGSLGTVEFTVAPPVDVFQAGDPWPGMGMFVPFDSDPPPGGTGSPTLNGSVDDNGTFLEGALTYSGPLTGFPVTASADAAGVWDVTLSTSSGDSRWDGQSGPVPTILIAGTISVTPSVSLTASSFAMPPGATVDLVVSGDVVDGMFFGVTILVELVPRGGNTGTLTFTPAPPDDITQVGDPWPGMGTFTSFDTDGTGSSVLNGSVDDNGTFTAELVNFSGPLTSFPVSAGPGADGVWDVKLTTAAGSSGWDNLAGDPTALLDGVITVSATACVIDADCDDANVCTSEVCNAGVCAFTDVPGPCDDGDACTVGDTCQTGFCQSGSLVDCTAAGDQCNVASCDPAGLVEGNCDVLTPVADGTACLDADVCNVGETCQLGVCIGGAPVDCTAAGGPCNTAACDPLGAEGNCDVLTPLADGTVCDDADPCNVGETCLSGVCTGGAPVDCTAMGDDCNVASCDAAGLEGNCDLLTPLADGTACPGTDVCLVGETCQVGVCTGGTPVDCTAAGGPCATASCDPAGLEGNCDVTAPLPDGLNCDDGLFCTVTDTCSGGVCVGTGDPCTGRICDESNDACVDCFTDSDCDDANPCTDDSCIARTCLHFNNALPCDNGNACTVGDTCSAGLCLPGSPVDCSAAGDQCNTASCDPAGVNGNCAILTPLPDGTACDDGTPCTTGDACLTGSCSGVPVDCTALDDACNVGTCEAATGICRAIPTNEGGPCDDGFPCTVGDACAGGVCSGTLSAPPAVNLSWSPSTQTVQVGEMIFIDLIATSGTCLDQAVGSISVILNWDRSFMKLIGKSDTGPIPWVVSGFPDDSGADGLNAPFTGTPDNDGDALYQALSGFPAGSFVPPTGVVVTTFEFQALDGTTGTPVVVPPTAGLFTRTRVLGAGADLGVDVTGTLGSATVQITECQLNVDCDDGNVCTDDTCTAGVCGFTNNVLPCDDGLFCTTTDVCSGGLCVGSGDPCTAPLLCSEALDACVPCLTPADCNDGNLCTDDVCDAAGNCSNPNNTIPCDDGWFCTATDACSGGVCVGSGTPCPGSVCDEAGDRCVQCLVGTDCDDGNVCTDDVCSANLCQNPPNTLPCNDGLFCTAVDTCVNGVCVGTGDPCTPPLLCSEQFGCVPCLTDLDCDDGNICTTDACVFGSCSNINNTLPCDDGFFCTATDVCSGGVCVGSGDPCPGQLCDEPGDRCVDCFTVADCPDDAVACTDDACSNGACLHTPNDALCDDGVFCNGAEFCDGALGCVLPGNPCDDPALCDEVNDLCGCREPVVVAEGPRFLAVTPRPGATPVALLVTGVDPLVSCVSLYVQGNGTLGTSPVFKPPSGFGGWDTVHLHDEVVWPDTTFTVQAECETGQGLGLSTPAMATTWLWGDVDNSRGLVNIIDITLLVDGFRGFFVSTTLYNLDLWGETPESCEPQLRLDILDLTAVVDAFKGALFPCAFPCQ